MKLRQTRSRQTRDHILAAARDLFSRQGYEQTSIDQIANAAKVAKSSVFAHFGDKTNLLAALGLTEIEQLAEAGRKGVGIDPEAMLDTQIGALLSPWLTYFCREPAFAELYLSQAAIVTGPYTETFMRLCFEVEDQVAALFTRVYPSLTSGEARLYARGAQALFHEVIVFEMSEGLKQSRPNPAPPQQLLSQMLTIWVDGVAHGRALKA
ncbi:TetR family transcriptional regulator [Agrobacterium sp. MA01]|uniref:TetR/AcrR family transcriptional regulator n=1 Tax=Agrobacterium sp. MA01 TaxID=2664893 RepID=UPI00129B25DF|nr:TetR/AcrR family transcriptional regulator [Agrobacterium sp. MA01]QGG90632.1 TetR family transcriptional regulator [Agrobacterium sp. MA01]